MTQPNQRHSTRSPLDGGSVEVEDIESGIGFRAEGVNVSDGGLSFEAPMEPALGAQMYVSRATGARSEFTVLRIKPTERGFAVAGSVSPRVR